jgi:hypothetical protein
MGVVHICNVGGVMKWKKYDKDFTERPYFNKNVHDLSLVVAKQFAKHQTDKRVLRLVLQEMNFRKSINSKFLKGLLETYFKSLPK